MPRPVRVYLDTGNILDRADGRIDPALLRRLDETVSRLDAHTVVSLAHFWDVNASESESDRARAIATISSLKNLRGVVVTPSQIETPRLDAAMRGLRVEAEEIDIKVEPIHDLAAVLADRRPQFEILAKVGAGMASAENIARPSGRPKPKNPATDALFERLVNGEKLSDLVKGMGLGQEQLKAFEPFLPLLDATLPMGMPRLRAGMMSEGGAPNTYARTMRRTGGSPASIQWSSVRGGEDSLRDAARRYAPGAYLSARLSQDRASNFKRQSDQSDQADLAHIAYLPYMDFATVDRANHGLINQSLGELQPRPGVRLFRNSQLSDLVEALEAL